MILFSCITAQAQFPRIRHFLHLTDSILSLRYNSANIDTSYVVRPKTKWTLSGRANMSGAKISTQGKIDGRAFESQMKADYKTTLSAAVNFQGISVSLALNPAKLMGKYNDYELNLNSYGKKLGFEFVYQRAKNFKGWHDVEGEKRIKLPTDFLSLKSINANAYFVFNSRRFSYPAALTQSYIQRRSAGSFLLSLAYQGQQLKSTAEPFIHLRVMNIGMGGGYGYNYVPFPKWLFHISAMPNLIVYSNTSVTDNDERVPLHYHFPEVIITSRGAVVKQIGKRYFTGLSGVFNFTGIGNKRRLEVENTKWRFRVFFGIRL